MGGTSGNFVIGMRNDDASGASALYQEVTKLPVAPWLLALQSVADIDS